MLEKPGPLLSFLHSSCDETPPNPTPGNLGEPCTPGLGRLGSSPMGNPTVRGHHAVRGPHPVQNVLKEAGDGRSQGIRKPRGIALWNLGPQSNVCPCREQS